MDDLCLNLCDDLLALDSNTQFKTTPYADSEIPDSSIHHRIYPEQQNTSSFEDDQLFYCSSNKRYFTENILNSNSTNNSTVLESASDSLKSIRMLSGPACNSGFLRGHIGSFDTEMAQRRWVDVDSNSLKPQELTIPDVEELCGGTKQSIVSMDLLNELDDDLTYLDNSRATSNGIIASVSELMDLGNCGLMNFGIDQGSLQGSRGNRDELSTPVTLTTMDTTSDTVENDFVSLESFIYFIKENIFLFIYCF